MKLDDYGNVFAADFAQLLTDNLEMMLLAAEDPDWVVEMIMEEAAMNRINLSRSEVVRILTRTLNLIIDQKVGPGPNAN